jgi:hypothetical protein
VPHRRSAAVACSAAALLAVAGASSASASSSATTAKLSTADQSALLTSHAAVVTIDTPAKGAATVALYADGRLVTRKRHLVLHRATHTRQVLSLTRDGMALLRNCTTRDLELRLTIRHGARTTTVRDNRKLVLDARHCPAPAQGSDARPEPSDSGQQQSPSAPAADAPAVDSPSTDTPAAKSDKGLFRVGTAVEDISPTTPMADGGYSSNYIVTGGVHDPLQVRAFFIGHGNKAVTLVSLDSQGWFAAYQAPNVGDGAVDARNDAAAALASKGYDVNPSDIVVSATHDHAAPTIQGIWGHTDPAYLHKVKQAAVKAVVDAEANAQDAELYSATGNIRGLLSQVQGTDQMAGFAVDDQMPILWAKQPGTGATIGMYADVPVHVDEYDPTRPGNNQFSADYPGYVRDQIAKNFGGTSVIAAGTLGRQESIGAAGDWNEVTEQGKFIYNQLTRALTHAHRITDTTLAANTQSFSTAAENQGLLAAMSCNHVGGPIGCPGPLTEPAANNGMGTWDWRAVGGIFTINRSLSAPFFNLNGGAPTIGTTATVARIGDQLFATAPGEAFPEVTAAIQREFSNSDGIRDTHIVDHASDQLGYYWDQRAGVYPSAQLAQSDFSRFNVGSHLAQDNVNAIFAAGQALGLNPTMQNPFAQIDNPNAFSQPGVQFYADQNETSNPTLSFYGTAKKAQQSGAASTSIGSTAATQNDGKISWDFGDGTTDVQPISSRFTHTFAGPGSYRVQASITDNLGNTYRWVQTVKIDPPLSVSVDQSTDKNNVVLTADAVGGERFDVLAAHWTFSDGSTADGNSVTPPAGATSTTVTIVDGAGNTATASVAIS